MQPEKCNKTRKLRYTKKECKILYKVRNLTSVMRNGPKWRYYLCEFCNTYHFTTKKFNKDI